MEEIKTSQNVEFDVIYADGTRRHVSEGVLFEVEDEKLIFHNGTSRKETLLAVAEAAAEVIGGMNLTDAGRALMIYNIHKRIMGRNNMAADFSKTKGGRNNGI